MADIHNELRRGQLGVALKAAVGDSRGGALERWGETLTPVMDMWSRPEWEYLRGDHLGSVFLGAGAIAAEFSFSALSLPLASESLVIVEGIKVRGNTAIQLAITARSTIAATGTAATPPLNRDMRYQPNAQLFSQSLPVESWIGSDPTTIAATFQDEVNGTGALYGEMTSVPYIIKPGGAIFVIGFTVNTSIQTVWKVRTRKVFKGELSLGSV